MAVTTATIARDILVQAAAGMIATSTFPGASFTVDHLAEIWFNNMPQTSYPWVDQASIDVDPVQSNTVHTAWAGATLVYWDLMVANGQTTVAKIDAAVTLDPYLIPSMLTGGSGVIDLENGMASLPSPGVVNNDPFHAFPALYPTPPDIWHQAALAALTAAGYTNVTEAQIDAAAEAIEEVMTTT